MARTGTPTPRKDAGLGEKQKHGRRHRTRQGGREKLDGGGGRVEKDNENTQQEGELKRKKKGEGETQSSGGSSQNPLTGRKKVLGTERTNETERVTRRGGVVRRTQVLNGSENGIERVRGETHQRKRDTRTK